MGKSRIEELRDDALAVKRFFSLLWSGRGLYLKYLLVAVLLASVIAFSIPKTYFSSATLVPENYPNGASAGVMSLAGMAGINMSYLTKDAYSVDMYPMIVNSPDILTKLGAIRVNIPSEGIDTTYSAYLQKYQKTAWWSYPLKWLKSSSDKDGLIADNASNLVIRNNVRCEVDKIKGIIAVAAYDQNPFVCKIIADSLVKYLNEFVQDYRTKKTSNDYKTISLLADSLRDDYIDAQKIYSDYLMSERNTSSVIFKQQCAFLEGEVQLAYAAYTQMMTQAQTAKIKQLESAPVYTVIESPVVPTAPYSPKRMLFYVLFVSGAFLLATVKILYVYLLRKQ